MSEKCGLSLGTVNPLINRLEGFGALERKPLGFRLVDPKRALLYWAATRDLAKDVTYTTFVPSTIKELEAALPQGAVRTAYSGFRAALGSTPTEYDQVFVYAEADEIQRAFAPTQREKRNLFVLTPDEHLKGLSKGGIAPLVQVYVDLWNLGQAASRFVEELDRKFASAANLALEDMAKAAMKA